MPGFFGGRMIMRHAIGEDARALPFDDLSPPAIPRDLGAYLEFRRLSIEFTEARNRRIDQLALDAG